MSELRYCVYIHTCLAFGSSFGKVYVGQTSQKPESRWGCGKNYKHCLYFDNAIKKYGWDSFSHEVIADGLTRDEADLLEIELIAKYKSDDPRFGFNLTRGGHSLVGAENPVARSVVVFNCESGLRVAEFGSLREASAFVGHDVFNALNGVSKTCGKYICRYATEVIGVDSLPEDECLCHHAQPQKRKAVSQYSRNGDYLRTYSSIREAAHNLGISEDGITNAVCNRAKSSGGYQWRYADLCIKSLSPLKSSSEVRKENGNYKGRCIDQIDVDTGEIINTYPSLREAARAVNGNRRNIKTVADGRTNKKTSSGYIWRYSE